MPPPLLWVFINVYDKDTYHILVDISDTVTFFLIVCRKKVTLYVAFNFLSEDLISTSVSLTNKYMDKL